MTRNRLSIILISGLVITLVFGWLSGTVSAQVMPDTTIDWFVIASGGGSSSGNNITLESTVGQPIAGSSAGGVVTLETGYWSAEERWELYTPLLLK
jgi:hypothetical protein